MAKKSNNYWKKRFEAIEAASNSYGHQTFKNIEPAFDIAQKEIEKEIEAWYGRFAKSNKVTMQEARRLLNGKELKELWWDVDKYIKYGRENNLNGLWMKELENASARVHISRLEALKIRTQQYAEVAFGKELDEIDAMARKVFTEDYYHSIFEVQKGFNIGWEIGQIDERKLDTLITKPWAADGKNFSDRIWSSKTDLVTELHNQLTRSCILGKAPDDAINAISKKFNTSKSQAGRLVMTEQAYFHSVAQKEAFKDLDVEEFEIVATLDGQTSEVCREMDGKCFPMKDYEPGVTAPPFHVWCRSVTVPYFEDNYTGERAARNADGQTYYVPDSMTYRDWKAEHSIESISQSNKEMFEKYKMVLGDLCPDTIDSFMKIKYNNDDKWSLLKKQYRVVNSYEINSGTMNAEKIFELDKKAIHAKFMMTGKARRQGNMAIVDFDGVIKYANSQINDVTDPGYYNFKEDKNSLILETKSKEFKTIVCGISNREVDSEAKIFEYLNSIINDDEKHDIYILSEKCMCDSCLGVMKQFKQKYPNITVNAVSNKRERNEKNGGKPWFYRMGGKKKK